MFASPAQKIAIIDHWVLFNNNSQSQSFTILVIILSVIIYVVQTTVFLKIRKLDREEIDRLSEYKRIYHELMIGKTLKSSKPKK